MITKLLTLLAAAISCGTLLAGPLDNWTRRESYGATNLLDVAYGAGKYVILAGDQPNRIITISDLTKATPDSVFVTNAVYSVVYVQNKFVVIGTNVLVSTNGIDWMPRSIPTILNSRTSLVYDEGHFVAASGSAIASEDGLIWNKLPLPYAFEAYKVAHGNGVWLFVSSDTNFISTDLKTFRGLPPLSAYSVGFGNGVFVAMGNGVGDNIYTSVDGANWTKHGLLDVERPLRLAFGNGYFVTGGGFKRAYSADGISWTVIPSATRNPRPRFVNGRFVSTGFGSIDESDPVIRLNSVLAQELQVTGAAGQTLRLESTPSLTSSVWTASEPFVIPPGESTARVPLSSSESSQLFFRAVLVK